MNQRGYSAIGLIGSKKDPNIGGALRAAHCYGAAMVVIQNSRCLHYSTDTTKMFRHIPLINATNILESLPYNCEPIAVEFIKTSRSLISFVHPERAMYIFGPEDGNIPEEIRLKCTSSVYIPTNFCMNLAATVNVVLYDRMAKSKKFNQQFNNETYSI